MQYVSTRAAASAASQSPQQFSDILLGGLAPDGGLYLPTEYPQVTGAELDAWRKLSYAELAFDCLLYTSPSPRDRQKSRMPSSA